MRYHYMIDSVRLPKSRIGKGGQSVSIKNPELLDQSKTRISYLIRTYNPYKLYIENRPFKEAMKFFARNQEVRYNILFFQRWQEFNLTTPEQIVHQIHNDMESRGFNLQLLSQLF